MRLLASVLLLLIPSWASADRVTVMGTTLEGKLKSISAKGVVLETVYGKGALTIAMEKVEAIESDVPFHVYKADDGTEVGRLVGISAEAVTLVREDGRQVEVPFAEVQAAPRGAGPEAGWFARERVERPWWNSNVDLSFASFDGNTHTTALATKLGVKRERGPNRTRFETSYLRSTTREDEDDPDTTDADESDEDITADELRGFLRHDHDVTSRFFVFGSGEAEHDGVEELAIRLIPRVGAGYKLVKTENAVFSVDAGPSYVYQRFFGGDTESYMAIAFGAEADVKLPFLGASWQARADYMPSFTAWSEDYRLRGETSLVFPLMEHLAFKASVIDEYNSSPAEDSVSNSLSTLVGLSFTY